MKPVTLLHIGLPKTGTTSIQNYLYRYGGVEQGVHYCHYFDKPIIQSRCCANAVGLGVDAGVKLSPDALVDRIRAAFNAGDRIAIISDETLSRIDRIDTARMQALLDGLNGVSDLRIVMGVRPWFEWLESLINQSLRMGTLDPARFDPCTLDDINKYPIRFDRVYSYYRAGARPNGGGPRLPVHFIDQTNDVLSQFEAIAGCRLFERTRFEQKNLSPSIRQSLAMFAVQSGLEGKMTDGGWSSFLSAADAERLYARHRHWLSRLSDEAGQIDDFDAFRARADRTGAMSYARELVSARASA